MADIAEDDYDVTQRDDGEVDDEDIADMAEIDEKPIDIDAIAAD